MSESEQAAAYVPNWSMNDVLCYQRERATQKRKCDVENAMLRNIDKRAKELGLPIEVIRAVDRVRKREKAEAEVYMSQFMRITAANGVVSGPQLNIWAQEGYEPTDEEAHLAAVARAEDEGFKAGRGGLDKDANQYPIGSEESQAWVRWWQNGVNAQKHITGGEPALASRTPTRQRQREKPKQLPAPEPEEKRTAREANVVKLKPAAPKRKGGGRPKGSKNKPKNTAA